MSDETTARGRGLVRLFWNLLALHPTALRGGIACFHLGAGIGSFVLAELYLPRVKDSFQFEVIVELFTCAILSIGMGGYAGACMITQTATASSTAQSKPAPTAKEHHPCSQLILS